MITVEYFREKREFFLMRQIYSAFMSIARTLEKKVYSDHDLTSIQCMVILTALLSPDGEISMAEIARKTGVTKQNVNRLIPLLEKKGYVSRSSCQKDKRMVKIMATDLGIEAMLGYVEGDISYIHNLFNDLNKIELELLWELLWKLRYTDKDIYPDLANDVHRLLIGEHIEWLAKILADYDK